MPISKSFCSDRDDNAWQHSVSACHRLVFVFNRLWYEMGILLFRVFHSQRDMVDGLNKIVNSVELMSQMQIKSGQYYCDRLADICDLLKVGGANDQ